MKVLTIRQPWAWAIAAGHKQAENRSWNTRYRGPVLIHAAKSKEDLRDCQDDAECDPGEGHEGCLEIVPGVITPPISSLALGAIIGIADLAECVELPQARRMSINQDFVDGPHCFILKNARAFSTPIPATGSLGLWDLPADLAGEVARQVNRARGQKAPRPG